MLEVTGIPPVWVTTPPEEGNGGSGPGVDPTTIPPGLREDGVSDGPNGLVTMDPETHHTHLPIATAELNGGLFNIIDIAENQPPADTQAVCDLIANPNQAKMYRIEVD